MIVSLLCFMIFMLLFLSFYLFFSGERKAKLTTGINAYLKKLNGWFKYDRIEDYLRRCGNPYKMTPLSYLIGKILIALILMFMSIFINMYFLAIPAFLCGYFLIDIILWLDNKEDMKKIGFQFRDVYDSLSIQMAAGTFIVSSLSEAYLLVTNKRLKRSLAVLAAEINITKNIPNSLEHFAEQYKKNDPIIDNFVLTINQSLETGQGKEQISDISEEISDMAVLSIQENTRKISDNSVIIQLFIFTGIFFAVLYLLGVQLGDMWRTDTFFK